MWGWGERGGWLRNKGVAVWCWCWCWLGWCMCPWLRGAACCSLHEARLGIVLLAEQHGLNKSWPWCQRTAVCRHGDAAFMSSLGSARGDLLDQPRACGGVESTGCAGPPASLFKGTFFRLAGQATGLVNLVSSILSQALTGQHSAVAALLHPVLAQLLPTILGAAAVDLTTAAAVAAASQQLLDSCLGPALCRSLQQLLLGGGDQGSHAKQGKRQRRVQQQQEAAAAGGRQDGGIGAGQDAGGQQQRELLLVLRVYAAVIR
jgi:hypothetical protein